MSISTLKNAKVGDKVSMLTFTGMNLGQFEITKAGKTKIAIMKKDGTQAEFSRETGVQTNANNPKYANKVVDPIPETAKADKKAPAKKSAAKKEEAKGEAKPTKKAPAKTTKKTEKVEIPEDADDFDEDEDFDDDFEEFDEE